MNLIIILNPSSALRVSVLEVSGYLSGYRGDKSRLLGLKAGWSKELVLQICVCPQIFGMLKLQALPVPLAPLKMWQVFLRVSIVSPTCNGWVKAKQSPKQTLVRRQFLLLNWHPVAPGTFLQSL